MAPDRSTATPCGSPRSWARLVTTPAEATRYTSRMWKPALTSTLPSGATALLERRDGDEAVHRLAGNPSHWWRREERGDELESPRQRRVLIGIDAEDDRPRVVLGGERLERRRRRRLRAELALEARIVQHHQPAVLVSGQARPAEQMVETDGHGREALIRREPIDPIAVLFSEEQTARPGIDRETSEHGLTGSLGKRDDDPRGEGAVDGL